MLSVQIQEQSKFIDTDYQEHQIHFTLFSSRHTAGTFMTSSYEFVTIAWRVQVPNGLL